MKKMLSFFLALVLSLGCLSGVTLGATVIATVTYSDGTMVDCTSGTELANAMKLSASKADKSLDGRTVVDIKADFNGLGSNLFGTASFTLNLNGHTIESTSGNAVTISQAGTENAVTKIVGPGTIKSLNRTVCIRGGSVEIDNVTMISSQQYALNLDYNNNNTVNSVENSTLLTLHKGAYQAAAIAFGSNENVSLSLKNSRVISSYTGENGTLFGDLPISYTSTSTVGATVTVGKGVDFYTVRGGICATDKDAGSRPIITLNYTDGASLQTVVSDKSASVSVASVSYTGLNHYRTLSDPLATVTTSQGNVTCYNHGEIKTVLLEKGLDGRAVVKILRDYTADGNAFLGLVPTFTLDLNGHKVGSVTNNGVQVRLLGTENSTTRIIDTSAEGGGILFGNAHAVKVEYGGLYMDGVSAISNGATVTPFQLSAEWNDDNRITNCTLVSRTTACFSTYDGNAREDMALTVENSTLVSCKESGSALISMSSDGTIILGENVEMYTYHTGLYYTSASSVEGPLATFMSDTAAFTHEGLELSLTGLHYWTTRTVLARMALNGRDLAGCTNAGEIRAALKTNPGATVTLMQDLTVGDDSFLSDGLAFTLDLNGRTVTSGLVDGTFCNIVDSQQEGLLKVDRSAVLFSENNSALPLWDESSGGFRMAEMTAKTLAPIWKQNSVAYTFRFDIANPAWEPLLAAAEETECGLRINWDTNQAASFKMTADQITKIVNNPSGGFKVTVTGLSDITGVELSLWFTSQGVTVTAGTAAEPAPESLQFRQEAMVETALAYYNKGSYVQYDRISLSRAGRIYGARTHLDDRNAPEYASEDMTVYAVCASWAYDLAYQTFGWKLMGSPETAVTKNLSAITKEEAGDAFVMQYTNLGDAAETAAAMAQCKALIQPGDIITYYRTNNSGHSVIYTYDLTGDGKNDILHSSGSRYSVETGLDNVEARGILRNDAESFLFAESSSQYLGNAVRFSVVRPAALGVREYPTTAAGKSRMTYPGLSVSFTMESGFYGAVAKGDTLTYTLTVKNNSSTAYSGIPVTFPAPENAMLSMVDGKSFLGDTATLSLSVGAGNTVTHTFAVTATGAVGEDVVSAGSVADIALPVNRAGITVFAPTAEKLLTDAAKAAAANASASGADFANAWYEAAFGADPQIPELKDLLASHFTRSTYNSYDMYTPKETLHPMMVTDYYGGRNLKVSLASHRVLETRTRDLMAGDVLLVDKSFTDGEDAVAWVYDGASLWALENGILTAKTEADMTALHSCDLFVLLRPTYSENARLTVTPAVPTVADTPENRQKAMTETSLAYYYKDPYVQYDRIRLSRAGRIYGARAHMEERNAPEYASADLTLYSVCAAWAYDVAYDAFGYRIMGDPETAVTKNLSAITPEQAGDAFVYQYTNTGDAEKDTAAMNECISLMQPGDVVTVTVGANGHTVVITHDLNGDGIWDILNCSSGSGGGRYSLDSGRDLVEVNGGIFLRTDFPRYYTSGGYTLKNAVRYSVVRPAADKSFALSDTAKARLTYPGLTISYTTDQGFYGAVAKGETLTYTLTLKNNGASDYTGLVSQLPVPENTLLLTADGKAVSGGLVSFTDSIASGETVTHTIAVKAVGKAGTDIVANGFVSSIPLPTLQTGILAYAPDAASLQSVSSLTAADGGTAFVSAYYKAALGKTVSLPTLEELLTGCFTQSSYSVYTMYTTTESQHPMMVTDYYGGQNLKDSLRSHRVLELRKQDLLPGDVLLMDKNLQNGIDTVAWIYDGVSLWALENGVLTEKTDADLTALHVQDFFVLLRPAQMA